MGAVGRIAHEDEAALGQGSHPEPQEPDGPLGRGPVAVPLLAVEFGRAVEGDRDRQGPGAGSERGADQDGRHDPAVAVPPGGGGVREADGVAVAGRAVNRLTGVGLNRVSTARETGPSGRNCWSNHRVRAKPS
jgi:hypothetical protein